MGIRDPGETWWEVLEGEESFLYWKTLDAASFLGGALAVFGLKSLVSAIGHFGTAADLSDSARTLEAELETLQASIHPIANPRAERYGLTLSLRF